jgi:hypothetical protein
MAMMSNEAIINRLIIDLEELIPELDTLSINDPMGDYIQGVIERTQTVLRMMGVPEERIPTDGSC